MAAVGVKVNSQNILFYALVVLDVKLRDVGASAFSGRHLLVFLILAICLSVKLNYFFPHKLQVQIRKQKASGDLECDGI